MTNKTNKTNKTVSVLVDREVLLTNLIAGFTGYKSALETVADCVNQTTLHFMELGITVADVATFATENQHARVVPGSRQDLIKTFRADFVERIQSPKITQPTALDYWSKLLKGVKVGYGIKPAEKVKAEPKPEGSEDMEKEGSSDKGYSLKKCAGACNQLIIWLQSQEDLQINVTATVKSLQEAIRLMGVTTVKE